MVELKAFQGLRYNPKKVSNMRLVTAPPHDVISPVDQDIYYQNSEHNVIRLILGKEYKDDSSVNNRYTRAAACLRDWLREEILVRDTKPSLYVYEEDFPLDNGKRGRRLGFIALVKLEPFEKGVILPHEEIIAKSAEDRFKLIKECKANFSCIFSLYSDPHGVIQNRISAEIQREPVIDFVDANDIRHKIWVVDDARTVKKIIEEMKDKKLYIADGHHRYESALSLSRLSRDSRYGYAMMLLVDMNDPGLVVLPTHRLLRGLPKLDVKTLEERLLDFFDMKVFSFGRDDELAQRKKFFEALESEPKHSFGMFLGNGRYYLLSLKDDSFVSQINEKKSLKWRSLDVSILHKLIIERVLGLKDQSGEKNIKYVKSREEALQLVYDGKYKMAFFMNPTQVSQIKDVADKGERMPPKSTYFFPKPLSGIVLNDFKS